MPLAKTDPTYWDENWYCLDTVPSPIVPEQATYLERKWHELFTRLLAHRRGQKLLEIGCGGSRWLPYFALEHGLQVSGVDYAPRGCALARQVLARAGVAGEILQADAFAENLPLHEQFDIVVSFGVLEHFSDTSGCVAALRRYLKRGGILVTTVPNMRGAIGTVQRRLNRAVYDNHVPLTRGQLAEAHARAGMNVIECAYLGSSDFHALNVWNVPRRGVRGLAVHAAAHGCYRFSRAVWAVERVIPLKPGAWLAPTVYCVATAP